MNTDFLATARGALIRQYEGSSNTSDDGSGVQELLDLIKNPFSQKVWSLLFQNWQIVHELIPRSFK